MGSGFRVVGLSVNLSNKDVGLIDEVGSDLLPDWSKRFAVWQTISKNSL